VTPPPRCSLIISTCNAPEYLARVLRAVSRQTASPDEVLLADDGSGEETKQVFARWTAAQSRPARHLWQPHDGFRKARILNQAIAAAQNSYLVFLDGDTLPHPQFVSDHRRVSRRGCFVQGHRLLVNQAAAQWFGCDDLFRDRRRALWRGQLRGLGGAFRWPRPQARVRSDLEGIRGCNLAVWRDDLVQVNGYNEAFKGWGREDSELAVRLMNSGIQRLDVRGWALCYHLWHPPAGRAGVSANDELLARAQRARATRCESGLSQHLPSPAPLPASTRPGGSA
jgi:glycosyltransferase involved in cell wall biosynthesis